MTVNKENNNGSLTLSITGRIDTNTAPALEGELKSSFDSCSDLTLDFSKVEYISSAGLRVLLSAQKIMSKKSGIKLINVSNEIMEIFEVTGFSDILTIK